MGIGAEFALVGSDIIRFLFGPGWEEAGRIFALFGPGIGVGLIYYTHGWIHLSTGRPERWFRWGLLEFVCTASLFLLALRWGPSGIALAWTTSYFLLVFPGLWYAGRPIGLGIGSILAVTWKFFASSIAAGVGTALIISVTPYHALAYGAAGAFVRIVSVSLVFVVLYLAGVIALHQGLRPLRETVSLIHELLPERAARGKFAGVVDTEAVLANPDGMA
jgi:PST family polysaccharide transporter